MQVSPNFPNASSDGRVMERGQGNAGDTRREVYRLTTYAKFPEASPANPCVLARHGFYYTGYSDRVKCFSCGRTVQNWASSDDPSLAEWHSRDCPLTNGTDVDNIPILPGSPTGTRRPTSRQARQSEANNDPSTSGQQRRTFPRLSAANPHMGSEDARLQTFPGIFRNWPAHRIRATRRQMAQAGLYYLGEGDRTKCWYCNGVLQNWEMNDDPWVEHAKWYPRCEFLLERKGLSYVRDVISQYFGLNNEARPLSLAQLALGAQRTTVGRVYEAEIDGSVITEVTSIRERGGTMIRITRVRAFNVHLSSEDRTIQAPTSDTRSP